MRIRLPNPTIVWRRFRNSLRTVFTRGDFSTLIITCLLMLIPVLALNAALSLAKDAFKQTNTWPVSLGMLVPVAILSVIFGFLLSRSHYSEAMSLILSGIYGTATIGFIQFLAAPGDMIHRATGVISRFVYSMEMSFNGSSAGIDPFLLILFLSILIWFLGHNTAWHVFRLDRVWRAVLPPGIVLILNSFYNFDQLNLDPYLVVYIFLALLLVIRSHIEAREYDWYLNRINFNRDLRVWFFRSGAILGIILLLFAWLLPTGSAEDNAKRFQEFLNGDIINKMTQLLNKLFSPLEGQGVATADYYGQDVLTLGGAIQLGNQPVMVVKAPQALRYYWKSRVFDTYSDGKWTSPRSYEISSDSGGLTLDYPPTNPGLRQDVEQQVTMINGASSRLVYAAPQPVNFKLPVSVDVDYVDTTAKTVDPAVTRPVRALQQGDQYAVTSSVSIATAPILRNEPVDYPNWVKGRYFQLPPTVTVATRNLALQIVQAANATTVYDKAKAIERWLRRNMKYDEALPNPPPNADPVDWFLFTEKQGYCTYYASAMVVMLRSMNIPARMAAGFAQGIYDPNSSAYIVRERDAHTWVEVYFPDAGWVEFEPTSAQQSLDRPDPNAPQSTLTPTPTFTPSPSPSPTASPTVAGQSAPVNTIPPQPQATYTSTAFPSPTPTMTPTEPPPPQFLQVPPPVQTAVSFLTLLAVIITILSFAGVGFLWWVEYRGLDSLSPIGRAYARLAIYARWLGIPMHPASTPLERGRRIAREVPTGSRPVTTITDMYINERYARPHHITTDEEDHAMENWRSARRAFIIRQIKKFFRRA